MLDCRPVTPPSKAVRRARKQLSPKPQTPRFNPAVHQSPVKALAAAAKDKDDSFVAVIESRSPAKIMQDVPDVEMAPSANADQKASAVADLTKSSAKRSPRIEDSVAELDALEEAIDKIGQSLPAVMDEPGSPMVKARDEGGSLSEARLPGLKERLSSEEIAEEPVAVEGVENGTASKLETEAGDKKARQPPTKGPKAGKPASNVKASSTTRTASSRLASKEATSRPDTRKMATRPEPKATTTRNHTQTGASGPMTKAVGKTVPTTKRTSSVPGKPTPNSKAATKPTSPALSKTSSKPAPAGTGRPKPRVSSVSKAPFVPAKSQKAPTVATFHLPGDAISAKLKSQREERLQREAAAAQRQRAFKARPVRQSSAGSSGAPAPENVRSTATSRARLSGARGEPATAGGDKERARRAKPGSAPTSKAARKPAASTTAAPAKPALTPAKPRTANMKAVRSPPSAGTASTTVTVPKVRAKAPAAKTELQVRREKEEAAKRARDEAAERGRAASRVWAEKMKQRDAKRAESGTATVQEASSKNGTAQAGEKPPSPTTVSPEGALAAVTPVGE